MPPLNAELMTSACLHSYALWTVGQSVSQSASQPAGSEPDVAGNSDRAIHQARLHRTDRRRSMACPAQNGMVDGWWITMGMRMRGFVHCHALHLQDASWQWQHFAAIGRNCCGNIAAAQHVAAPCCILINCGFFARFLT